MSGPQRILVVAWRMAMGLTRRAAFCSCISVVVGHAAGSSTSTAFRTRRRWSSPPGSRPAARRRRTPSSAPPMRPASRGPMEMVLRAGPRRGCAGGHRPCLAYRHQRARWPDLRLHPEWMTGRCHPAPGPARKVGYDTRAGPGAAGGTSPRRWRPARNPVLVMAAGGCRAARRGRRARPSGSARRAGPALFSSRVRFPEAHPLFAGFLAAAPGAVSAALAAHDLVLVIGAPVFTFHVAGDLPCRRSSSSLPMARRSPPRRPAPASSAA